MAARFLDNLAKYLIYKCFLYKSARIFQQAGEVTELWVSRVVAVYCLTYPPVGH
jgi:hypothetical protein